MSKLQQLKTQLYTVSGDAKRTAGQISAFETKFAKAIGEVQQLIGGTATKADRQIIETLQVASAAVKNAVESLTIASQSAKGYADRI